MSSKVRFVISATLSAPYTPTIIATLTTSVSLDLSASDEYFFSNVIDRQPLHLALEHGMGNVVVAFVDKYPFVDT